MDEEKGAEAWKKWSIIEKSKHVLILAARKNLDYDRLTSVSMTLAFDLSNSFQLCHSSTLSLPPPPHTHTISFLISSVTRQRSLSLISLSLARAYLIHDRHRALILAVRVRAPQLGRVGVLRRRRRRVSDASEAKGKK
jgi:hypothetical protein